MFKIDDLSGYALWEAWCIRLFNVFIGAAIAHLVNDNYAGVWVSLAAYIFFFVAGLYCGVKKQRVRSDEN